MGSKVGRLSSILSLSYPALEPKGARTIVQPQKLFTSVLQTTYFSSNGNIYYILTDTFLSECVKKWFAFCQSPYARRPRGQLGGDCCIYGKTI